MTEPTVTLTASAPMEFLIRGELPDWEKAPSTTCGWTDTELTLHSRIRFLTPWPSGANGPTVIIDGLDFRIHGDRLAITPETILAGIGFPQWMLNAYKAADRNPIELLDALTPSPLLQTAAGSFLPHTMVPHPALLELPEDTAAETIGFMLQMGSFGEREPWHPPGTWWAMLLGRVVREWETVTTNA